MSWSEVSRVVNQLLKAVEHCASCGVIHRDIKPENLMFKSDGIDSELRLIDFGSSALHNIHTEDENEDDIQTEQEDNKKEKAEVLHRTMAGTPFYISPEMFQRKYSYGTDVWSVGVVLYVLVAGYPFDHLQEAFDIFHKKKDRNLRKLPNLPEIVPQSYFELLDGLLTYKHADRKPASHFLHMEFTQIHQ